MQWIWIGFGGMAGTLLRYFLDQVLSKWVIFPYSIFIVNMLGCFLLGLLISSESISFIPKNALTIGLCGGLTTFSTFSQHNILLLQQGEYVNFTVYSLGSLVLGLFFFWLGTRIL
jgi:fluoride exporter